MRACKKSLDDNSYDKKIQMLKSFLFLFLIFVIEEIELQARLVSWVCLDWLTLIQFEWSSF